MNETCPHCGQRMLARHGVQLSPREADLFDLVEGATRGRGGIDINVLGWTWAGDKPTPNQRNLVKTTICHINDKLAGTSVWIVGRGKHPVIYRVEGA